MADEQTGTMQYAMYQQEYRRDRTFLDKLFSKQEVDRIRDLVIRSDLKRGELLELLYMCLSVESKLMNFDEQDRYVLLKFFVWLREFIKIAEHYYDYIQYIEEKRNAGATYSPQFDYLLNQNRRTIEHISKFLIDLFLIIMRTTLSLGGTAFIEALKNRFEFTYNDKRVPDGKPQAQGAAAAQ